MTRKLMPLLALLVLAGCSKIAPQGMQVIDYHGPQAWPTGQPSPSAASINQAKVFYGLPDRPYQVVQIVAVPRNGESPTEALLDAWKDMKRVKPDALVLLGTRYDDLLDVDWYLANAGSSHKDCLRYIKQIRQNNRSTASDNVVFLAIRWGGQGPRYAHGNFLSYWKSNLSANGQERTALD